MTRAAGGRDKRRFGKDRSGTAAIEFAMVALPLMYLLFTVAELGVLYMTNSALELGVAETQRKVRTGEAQTAGLDAAAMKTELCSNTQAYFGIDCAKLYLDVRDFDSFATAEDLTPLDANGDVDTGALLYNPGGPSRVVLVRAFYEYALLTPGLSIALANMNGANRLLGVTILMRTEPYPT